ncbi:hypothetical protein MMC26_001573 [Xylographa opegraphella]|nr:hypothetical protein [Xylographa opegraphella]
MVSLTADNVEKNMSTNAVLVPKIEDIMDPPTVNRVEAAKDAGATPMVKDEPLFYTSSFKPSARLAALLNKIVAQKPITKLEDSAYIPSPTPEISTTLVDVAIQDDTTCPTPYCGSSLTFDSPASRPRSEVLSDPINAPTPNHKASSGRAAEVPTGQPMNITKSKVEDSFFSTSTASNEKIAPHLNATNQYIVHLRDEAKLGWMQIATMLNSQPATHPPPETSTSESFATPFQPSAVYSHYIRTKYHLRVAADAAEILARQQAKSKKRKRPTGRRCSDETVDANDSDFSASEKAQWRARAVRTAVAKGAVVWEEQMDKLLKDAVEEVKSEFWQGVAKRVVEKKGSVVQPSECAKRFVEVHKS